MQERPRKINGRLLSPWLSLFCALSARFQGMSRHQSRVNITCFELVPVVEAVLPERQKTEVTIQCGFCFIDRDRMCSGEDASSERGG